MQQVDCLLMTLKKCLNLRMIMVMTYTGLGSTVVGAPLTAADQCHFINTNIIIYLQVVECFL